MGRSALVLMALLVWSGTVGRTDAARSTELPKPSAANCQFKDSQSGMVTKSWLPALAMVSPAAALKCFNTIQLDYNFITESIGALADIFERTYVFVALAADPAGTKQSNPYGFKVFSDKVNVPVELRRLADDMDEDKPVPLGDVAFAINELFNRLRDAHVTWSGAGAYLGGVIPDMAAHDVRGGARAYLIDSRTSAIVLDINIEPQADDTLAFFFTYLHPEGELLTVRIESIDGADPMNTLIKWANSPVFSWATKALGTRVNELMGAMGRLVIKNMGSLTDLKSVVVDYGNGTTSTLNWAVTMSPDLTDAALAAYQEKANAPGIPIKALVNFLTVYINQTAPQRSSPPASDPPPMRAIKARRSQATGPSVTVTPISNYGFYYFNGTRATLKLTGFSFPSYRLSQWWPEFVAAAKKQGAKNLVIDLTDNGGGYISSGVGLALGLYPNARLGDFGMSYDRIIGPEAVYLYKNGLTPDALTSTYKKLAKDSKRLQARAKQINTNAKEFDRLARLTIGSFNAVSVLFNSSSAQTQACTNVTSQERVDCDTLWTSLTGKIKAGISSILNGNISADRLASLLTDDFSRLLRSFWPYGDATTTTATDPYTKPVTYKRGGVKRSYTGKYTIFDDSLTAADFFPNVDSTPPFQKIVAVGNGFCGSTCDTFSKAAWFFSQENPDLPKFKYATFGGTGNIEDSAGSSFPGGNVNGDDLLTQAWAYAAVAYLQAEWAGNDKIAERVSQSVDYLAIFPAFLNTTTPSYTQSEIYRKPMGPNALPMEYYLIPPDYQITAWYKETDIPSSGAGPSADLLSLYSVADRILKVM